MIHLQARSLRCTASKSHSWTPICASIKQSSWKLPLNDISYDYSSTCQSVWPFSSFMFPLNTLLVTSGPYHSLIHGGTLQSAQEREDSRTQTLLAASSFISRPSLAPLFCLLCLYVCSYRAGMHQLATSNWTNLQSLQATSYQNYQLTRLSAAILPIKSQDNI